MRLQPVAAATASMSRPCAPRLASNDESPFSGVARAAMPCAPCPFSV